MIVRLTFVMVESVTFSVQACALNKVHKFERYLRHGASGHLYRALMRADPEAHHVVLFVRHHNTRYLAFRQLDFAPPQPTLLASLP
jgi:hypothetical protein